MAFIEKISDYITNHYDLTKENLTIVFPNKRAALQLRNELSKDIKTNFWVPQIVSIQQAMEQWSGLQLIDNIEVIFEIIKMKQDFFSYAAQMAKDFDEIDQYGVDADKLFNHLKSAKELEEWTLNLEKSVESNYLRFFSELFTYYNQLRESLQSNGMGYYGMITRKIASYDDKTLLKCTNGRKIVFAGFNALTTTEENIVVRLVESGNAVILWDLDSYYIENEQHEAGYFARNFFKNHHNIPKNFIGDGFKTQPKDINIISVSGNSVQTNALQLQLSRSKRKKGLKEVIVLADESLLIPVLNAIPESAGDIRVTMGYPFANTVTNHFVDHFFRYQQSLASKDDRIYFWTLQRFCNDDFVKLLFKNHGYEKLGAWLADKAKSSVYYVSENDFKCFAPYAKLVEFLQLVTKKHVAPNEFLQALKSLLMLSAGLLDKQDYFIKNQISVAGRIVNRLELLLKKYPDYIQVVQLQALFTQVAGQMSINYVNQSVDGLQIMGLLETRNLDFDVIHFLSVNEGVLPKNKSNNSLIPYDLRRAYGLPTYSQQQAVYAYHFYRLLQNACEINLYYNNLADTVGAGMGEPSRFIKQLEFEYAKNNPKVTLEYYQYKSPVIKNVEDQIIVKKNDEVLKKITRLSPTSIGTYVKCPLQFYWKHIEGIQDDTPEEEIQVNVIGNIVHDTLDYLYEKFGHDIITPQLYNAVCDKYFKDCYKQALEHNHFADGLPDTGFNCLSSTVIDKMLSKFINFEKRFLAEGNKLSIIATETKLRHQVDIQGYKVELYGKADRIDTVNGETRVIDYKTGTVRQNDLVVKDDQNRITAMAEKSIQLLMYKYLYLLQNPDVNPDTVKPGIIGLQKLKNGVFELNISENHDLNKDFMPNCKAYFDAFLDELFNKDIPFTQTDDTHSCSYCDFRNICKR